MTQGQDIRTSYEQALRVIGRHLDAEPAYHISILEVADGFTVRYHPTLHFADGRTVHFGWGKLEDLEVFQTAGRGVQRRQGRYQGIWAKVPNGHTGFLRALGFKLDKEHAGSLSVDELEEGVQVSYVLPDPADPLRTQKYHARLNEQDIQDMANSAQHRRSAQDARGGSQTG